MDEPFDHGLPKPATRFQQWCGALVCAMAFAFFAVFLLPELAVAFWAVLGHLWGYLGRAWAGRDAVLGEWRFWAFLGIVGAVLLWWRAIERKVADRDHNLAALRAVEAERLRHLQEADPMHLPIGNYWVVASKSPADDQPQIVYWDGSNFTAMGSPHMIPRSAYRLVSHMIPPPRRPR